MRLLTKRRQTLLLLVAVVGVLSSLGIECGLAAKSNFGYQYGHDAARPQWTPDGQYIVTKQAGNIYVTPSDGSGDNWTLHERQNRYDQVFSPDLSPDGSRVVYARRTVPHNLNFLGALNYDIVVSDIDGSNYERLTKTRAEEVNPAWSPDGTQIAFWSDRFSHPYKEEDDKQYIPRWGLFAMSADGSNVRPIMENTGVLRQPPLHWSPDGNSIAFVMPRGFLTRENERTSHPDYPRRDAESTLYVAATDGSGPIAVVSPAVTPAWSPDSSRIAFQLNETPDANYYSWALYTIRPDGTDLRKVVGDLPRGSGEPIKWSSDGSEIRLGRNVIIVAKADGSERSILQGLHVFRSYAVWSPDGSAVAVQVDRPRSSNDEVEDPTIALFVMKPDGSDKRVLLRELEVGRPLTLSGEAWNPVNDYELVILRGDER